MTKTQKIWTVVILVAVIGYLIYENNKNKKAAALAASTAAANRTPVCAPGFRFDKASAECVPILVEQNRLAQPINFSNAAGGGKHLGSTI